VTKLWSNLTVWTTRCPSAINCWD